MKILIIGASGVLGNRLYNDAIKKKWDVLGTYYSHECKGLFYLDLADRGSIARVFSFFEPDVIVLAGGITNVDVCELKPRLAENINIKGTFSITKETMRIGAKLVYLSTDYVFDGAHGPYKEENKTLPINVYGKSKLEAEGLVKCLDGHLIIRTSQLYGFDPRGKNFTVEIIKNMRDKKIIYAAGDFYSTPTYTGSLSEAIVQLIKKGRTGVYHVSGTEFLSRYDYVCKISDIFGLDKSLIEKVRLKDLHLKAARPKKGGLRVDKISKDLGLSLLDCRKSLELFKAEY